MTTLKIVHGEMFIVLILEYVCFEKFQRINDDRDELKFHKPKIISIKPFQIETFHQ